MNNLAIIPARCGSKGLPDKNIRPLNGKPLLAYSIDAAKKSGMFSEIMVSTDSEKYAETARQYGASVPFLRSEKTACDTASSWEMVAEVLDCYKKLGKTFDSFCLLQPTSPLREAEDIIGAYKLFYEKADFSVVSVCECEHSVRICGTLPENHEFDNFIVRSGMKRRQDGDKYYRINGAIYIIKTDSFSTDVFPYQKGNYAYVMEQDNSVDIDRLLDFRIAEVIMNERNK